MRYTTKQEPIAKVEYFFKKISVIAFRLKEKLKVGEKVRIFGKGGRINITQEVTSIQIENEPIQEANPGDMIGLLITQEIPQGCNPIDCDVFKV